MRSSHSLLIRALVENYRLVTTAPAWTQSIGVRVGAPINNKDRLTFNVQYQDRDSHSKQLFGYTDTSSGYGLSASAGWSHSFAPRVNNSATLTFSRNITQAHALLCVYGKCGGRHWGSRGLPRCR